MGDGQIGSKRVFLSYLNDDDRVINGYVELLEVNSFVKFKTNHNIVSIPAHRVLKIKEDVLS